MAVMNMRERYRFEESRFGSAHPPILPKTWSRPSRLRRLTAWASIGYFILALAVWASVLFAGDRWWLATLILFGPRWILSLPLVILVPLAFWKNRRQLITLLIVALIVFGPFMGFCLPLRGVWSDTGPAIRVLTCNLQAGEFDGVALSYVVLTTGVDIVALQECQQDLTNSVPKNWQVLQAGELAILSRYPLRAGNSVQSLHPPHQWPRATLLHCTVQTPAGDLSFCTVHLPSPRYGLQTVLDRSTILSFSRRSLLNEEIAHRQSTSQAIQRVVASLPQPIIVAGDFNMPADSPVFRKFWGGYANAFSRSGFGYGLTEVAAIHGMEFRMRIDHILTGAGLDSRSCWVGPSVGSDHLPLIAEISKASANH
jgi:vancomycin resistance protein VanJ